jgi:two-component system chemotaxis sensor kinase CheA
MEIDDEILKEFLIESQEGLDKLDREFVAIERDPQPHARITVIFRTIHTIKGTSGFLGLAKLEKVAHAGESVLSALRDGSLSLTPAVVTALLAMVDTVRTILSNLEATGAEGDVDPSVDVTRLEKILAGEPIEIRAAPPPSSATAPPPSRSSGPSSRSLAQATSVAQTTAIVRTEPPRAPLSVPSTAQPAVVFAPEKASAEQPAVVFAPVRAPSARPPVKPASVRPVPVPRAPRSTREGSDEVASEVGNVRAALADTSVRVDVGLLDRLMNLVGELVLARNQILQHGVTTSDSALSATSQRLNQITTELQEGVMKARMQPIGNVWGKFPRVVRDLALACGKQVELEMEGKETELDRTIIEAIKDPLTHLVRNAVDHGVEAPEVRAARGKPRTGRLILRAYHEGGQVIIELVDDGGGIDPERVRARAVERGLIGADTARRMSERELVSLIFLPGFSTAEKVTNVSGRGVGMDVVKTNIEKIGGTVDIHSRPGLGTTLKVKIPLTLAIIPALIVTTGGDRYAIPQVSLLELVRLEGEQASTSIESVYGAPVYRLRGNLLPLVWLRDVLGLPRAERATQDEDEVVNIVVLQAEDRHFGLVVDTVRDTEEIVVKGLGKELKGLPVYAGATIMGDGKVALILDVLGIAQRSSVIDEVRDRAAMRALAEEISQATTSSTSLLLVGLGGDDRIALPLDSVARLEELAPDRIERLGSRRVVQYRGRIMNLVDLRERFGAGAPEGKRGPLQVVVHAHGDRVIGLVVDSILDIVEDATDLGHRSGRPGVRGALVVQGRVTELVDVPALVRGEDPSFYDASAA